MTRTIILAAIVWAMAVLCPAPALADEWDVPQPAYEGVWQGTVGAYPVHVCLDKTPYEQKGAYYYDRSKLLLRLVPGKAAGEWFEQEVFDKNGARWTLSGQQDVLTGMWHGATKDLPVRLKRIGAASKDFDGPCSSAAFNNPRFTGGQLTSSAAIMDGVAYTKWTFHPGPVFKDDVAIEGFTLDGTDAAAKKINIELRKILPKADGTGDWTDCVSSAINANAMDGEFNRSMAPTLITKRWMAVSESGEDFCGGAHPNNYDIPRLFDMVSGAEVKPLDWFTPAAAHVEKFGDGTGSYTTLTPAFVAVLLKGWKADDAECDEPMRSQDSWNVGVARGALVFTPDFPRVIMACGEDFQLTFAQLQPWLTAPGKAVVATLPR